MVDLGAGLKGASQVMKARGWEVITLDIDPRFNCTITADVLTWNPLDIWKYTNARQIDLLWFSMPCDEFSREFMPWSKTGKVPDMSLVLACLKIRDILQPKNWVCENVKGAIKYFKPFLGNYRAHAGPFYLWGWFAPLGKVDMRTFRKKESYSSSAPAERAAIPYALSYSMAVAIESQVALPLPNIACSGQVARAATCR